MFFEPLNVTAAISRPSFTNGHGWLPVAAAGDKIILEGFLLQEQGSQQFVLYHPLTDRRELLWAGPPDRQDIIGSYDGDWIVLVRTVHSLPLDTWTVALRNWRTGDVRELAHSDPRIPTYPDLHIGLPNGFAPGPDIRDGVVVWDEYFVSDTYVGKRIQLYDIDSGAISTLAQVDDARFEELNRPAHSRDKTAWIRLRFPGGKEEVGAMHVELLEDGHVTALDLPGYPYIIRFSSDGSMLYWDDGKFGFRMKRTDLQTMETIEILNRIGAWPYVDGQYIGAAVETKMGDTWVGYFDESTDTTYTHHIEGSNERGGKAVPVGKWFVWSVIVSDEHGRIDTTESTLHFLPLE